MEARMPRNMQHLLILLLCNAGCLYQSKDMPARPPEAGQKDTQSDTPLPDMIRDQQREAPETGLDLGLDFAIDASIDPECVSAPQGFFCFFESSNDPIGMVGYCQGGTYHLDHYCFSGARCSSALKACIPQGCNPCDLTCPTGACSFFPGGGDQYCCVGESTNGPGLAGDSCTANYQCESGLCTVDSYCYQYCSTTTEGSCPTGTTCTLVKVRISGQEIPVVGCQPLPPDSGAPDANVIDSIATDINTFDSGVTDTMIPDDGLDGAFVDGQADANVSTLLDSFTDF